MVMKNSLRILRNKVMTQEELNQEMNKAIHDGNTQAIGILVKLGVDPNFKCTGIDKFYKIYDRPLHVSGKDPSVVKLLIEAGADVNAKNGLKHTPLEDIISDRKNHLYSYHLSKSVKLLIDAGANPNEYGLDPPLHIAIKEDVNSSIASTLINAGADLNLQDYAKNTALHYAVLNKNSKTYVQMLIEAGADITLQNKDGKTPMDLVKTKTLRTFIENLLKDKALA